MTEEINGYCIASIVNTLERDITIDPPPHVELEEIGDERDGAALMFPSSDVESKDRLSKLRDELRTDHWSNEEKDSLVKICGEFNDMFHLPGDTLTFTAATEHTILTATIDNTRGINSLTGFPKYTEKKYKNKGNKYYVMES